jgi:hypothetical protein
LVALVRPSFFWYRNRVCLESERKSYCKSLLQSELMEATLLLIAWLVSISYEQHSFARRFRRPSPISSSRAAQHFFIAPNPDLRADGERP